MPEELSAFARLESSLYGSLMHAAGVLGRAFEADTPAIRLFAGGDPGKPVSVAAAGLGVSHAQEKALQSWPLEEGSLFAIALDRGLSNGAFRPRQEMDEKSFAALRPFGLLDRLTTVVDCLCLSA